MLEGATKNVFTIPAGVPFAKALAQGLLTEVGRDYPALAQMMIFLPTRRAARTLQDAFFELADGQALLLPRIHVIGSYDEDDLSLLMAGLGEDFSDIPPAIDPLYRQALLARLIQNVPGRSDTIAQAMELAGALAHLMDQVHTEGLDLIDLKDLVPEDFAEHWQITLDFLTILSAHWPQILKEKGVLDPAERRDILIRRLTDFWSKNPPGGRVIAAGSTGSIPATAEFLSCVAQLSQGQVVLPGFDLEQDFSAWDDLPLSHPQGGFKKLFQRMEMTPDALRLWPYSDEDMGHEFLTARRDLARQIMAPDHGTLAWHDKVIASDQPEKFQQALKGVHIYTVETQQDEANLIALWLRKILEHTDQRALLITPDRNLARRVLSVCRRWNLDLDDSAGEPLAKRPLPLFLRHVCAFLADPYDPVAVLTLLKDPACMSAYAPDEKEKIICEFEKFFIRRIEKISWASLLKGEDELLEVSSVGSSLLQAFFQDFIPFVRWVFSGSLVDQSYDLSYFLKVHLYCARALIGGRFALDDFDEFEALGRVLVDEDGESLENMLQSFSKLGDQLSDLSIFEYTDLFDIALNSFAVRSRFGVHPRIQVLGQMEARIMDADVVILGGLNEGTWPADDAVDPWMSRSMQQRFGLPTSDQYLSLSGHDFVQGFCQPSVVLTRCARIGSGFAVPSRWLQKLDVLARVADLDTSLVYDRTMLSWAAHLDQRREFLDCARPSPSPPLAVRPRRLSVTQIEKLIADPYSIYAMKILNLLKLPALSEDRAAAIRGMILHKALQDFVARYPQDLPEHSLAILMDLADQAFDEFADDPSVLPFWRAQFEAAFSSYLAFEQSWRTRFLPAACEVTGVLSFAVEADDFTLSGQADRIDISADDPQSAALIDYKTGGNFTQSALKKGDLPQLPLEALIAQAGGFANLPPLDVQALSYWYIHAGDKGGTATQIEGDLEALFETVRLRLHSLVRAYNLEGCAYTSLPNPLNAPRYNDYDHLARVREWSNNESTQSAAGEL